MKFRSFAFTIFILLLLPGFRFTCSGPTVENLPKISLQWWGVWESTDAVSPIIASFRKLHPNIYITYRAFRPEEYETQLLEAFAEDRAPDLYAIPNTWIRRYQNRLKPLPSSIELATLKVVGTIKQEVAVEMDKTASPTPTDIRSRFIDVVASDVIVNENIVGLPLATDVMVMYYNKDLLAQANIAQPAATWTELQDQMKLITKHDDKDAIQIAGASIGRGANIPLSPDIISLLMMQNGVVMSDQDGHVQFGSARAGAVRSGALAAEALDFYTDFSNPTKVAYSWNAQLPTAFDLFTQGRLAYFFGYAYHLSQLALNAPQLNWETAPVPQVDPSRKVNIARYWVQGVSSKTQHSQEAWGFLLFATKDAVNKDYLVQTKQPPAMRSLLSDQPQHPLEIFSSQLLTAKSWYRGQDATATDKLMIEMIDAVASGDKKSIDAVEQTSGKIEQTRVLNIPQ